MIRRFAKLPVALRIVLALSMAVPLGSIAFAQTIGTYSLAQSVTAGPVPSGTSAGVGLLPSGGYKVIIQAAANCVIADGGQLRAWTYSLTLGGWVREPGLDVPVYQAASTNVPAQQSVTLVERGRASNPQTGRLYFQTDGLSEYIPTIQGVDAGTANADGGSCVGNVTVVLDGQDMP